jgi:hypothetical protein
MGKAREQEIRLTGLALVILATLAAAIAISIGFALHGKLQLPLQSDPVSHAGTTATR